MDALAAEVTAQVARRIRRRRRYLDMTQEELAHRASIHRTQIPLIEGGRRMPKLHTLIRIGTALDISPCQLLEGIEWKPAGPASEHPVGTDDG
jgi:transcriptional regulator with XRE-family HTH domain